MQFRTQIPLKKQQHNQIDYRSKLLLLGSCFTENIGDKLGYFKFPTTVNPFGILFHPKAIEISILNAINKKEYTEGDIFFFNEQWHCFEAHSKLSNPSKEVLLKQLNEAIKSTHQQIHNSTHIIITLGTAWVYRFIETDSIVANCHKIPQKKFLKELLTADEITESLEATIALIQSVNKNASILFTVSPVRHLKDGFIENQQSKSHLITAVHNITNRHNVSYFPSYEIMMDELRDYRFYSDDMVHPNNTAIKYIWWKFVQVWVSAETEETMRHIETIQKGLMHRPFNSKSEQHQEFLKNLATQIKEIQLKFPKISF
jgi:lysophospholipase L1-like esterase